MRRRTDDFHARAPTKPAENVFRDIFHLPLALVSCAIAIENIFKLCILVCIYTCMTPDNQHKCACAHQIFWHFAWHKHMPHQKDYYYLMSGWWFFYLLVFTSEFYWMPGFTLFSLYDLEMFKMSLSFSFGKFGYFKICLYIYGHLYPCWSNTMIAWLLWKIKFKFEYRMTLLHFSLEHFYSSFSYITYLTNIYRYQSICEFV